MTVSPFLMFEGRAEEALTFYCETIPDSSILDVVRYGPGEPGPAGTIKTARASIGGLEIMASDSYVHHAFTFTPSISLFMNVDSEAELDRLVAALGEGGGMLMPTGDYGFSRRFAWLNDRFGVSWQINLP